MNEKKLFCIQRGNRVNRSMRKKYVYCTEREMRRRAYADNGEMRFLATYESNHAHLEKAMDIGQFDEWMRLNIDKAFV